MAHSSLYDYYKDVHGFRPDWKWVTSLSLEEAKKEMDCLSKECEAGAEVREREDAYYLTNQNAFS
jgi:hypothetical protein